MKFSNRLSRHKEESGEKEKENFLSRRKTGCIIFIIALLGLCGYVIYYFVVNIKDPLIQDYKTKSRQVQDLIPENNQEIEQGFEQGEELYEQTKEKVEEAQEKYEKVKEIYEKGKEIYESVDKIME